MKRSIYLEGELGLKFGSQHIFYGESVRDALRLIETNNPGLRKYLIDAIEEDIGFHVQVGDNSLEFGEECLLPLRHGDIIITPIPAGSKSGGAKILAAAVIAAILFIPTGGASGGLFAAAVAKGGFAALAAQAAAGFASNLAISGIQQLMSPDPSVDEKDEGYLFNGSEQNVIEGLPIPLLYGELRVPGYPVSFEIIKGSKRITSSGKMFDSRGNFIGYGVEDIWFTNDDLDPTRSRWNFSAPMYGGASVTNSQDILFTDIISEGPIQGLVDGGSSVYLNDDPGEVTAQSAIRLINTPVEFEFTNNSTLVTINKNGYEKNILADTAGGSNKFLILQNYGSQTGSVQLSSTSANSNSVTITASNPLFTSDFVYDPANYLSAAVIRILDSNSITVFEGYVDSFISSTIVTCIPLQGADIGPLLTNGTYTIVVDAKLQIASLSSNQTTLTLASAFLGNTGSYKCDFASNSYSVVSLEDRIANGLKYNSFDVQFRTGNLIQPAFSDASGTGVGSIAIGPGASFTPFAPSLYNDPDETDNPTVEYTGTSSSGFGLTSAQVEEVDELRVTFSYGQLWNRSETGKQTEATVRYSAYISLEKNGVWQPYTFVSSNWEHVDRRNAPTIFEEIVDMRKYQPFTDFKLKIVRTTANDLAYDRGTNRANTNYTTSSDASITSLNSIIKENLSYPLTAMAKVRVNSKDFQNVPVRTYHCKGLKVKVPSNYVTREEGANGVATYNRSISTGAIESTYQNWDGNFRAEKVYTNNPAWVFYDILTNNRYGLGEWLQAEEIDKYALYRIARYCDELVPDGNGGEEPRFTSNVYFTQASDAYKIVKDLATVFRGMMYWLDGEIYTTIDQPGDPVYNFSKGNVIDGAFSYETTGSKTRANQVIVTWNNPAANYKQENLIVEDKQNIIETGRIIPEEAVAFGATSEGQALRYGRWKLWTAVNQTEVVSFKTAINAAFLAPGDIVNVQDADRYPDHVKYSGRISNSGTRNTTTIPLDREVALTPGSSYEVSVLFTDNVATLAQESATIGSITYSRGDIINSSTIDTEIEGSNILDDNGDYVDVTWKPYTNVETKVVDISGLSFPPEPVSSLTVTTAFSKAPEAETVWVLTEFVEGLETNGSKKQYKILSIIEENKNTYGITAVEFFNEKYASVDENFILSTQDTIFSPPIAGSTIPAPRNAYIHISDLNSGQIKDDVILYWDAPTVDGSNLSSEYQYVDYYEITANIPDFPNTIQVGKNQRSKSGLDLPPGTFTIGIRTVAENGQKSDIVKVTFTIGDLANQSVPRAFGMALGGVSSSPAFITSEGIFTLEDKAYSISPVGNPQLVRVFDGSPSYEYTQDCSNIASIDYSSLSSADADYAAHYIMIDGDASDPLKLINYYKDNSLGYGYFYDAGDGSNDETDNWVSIGTVSVPISSNVVSGTGFNSSLQVGDLIKFSATQAAKVLYIASDTDVRIDKSFTTPISSVTAYKGSFRFDRNNDAVVYQVRNDNGVFKAFPINLIVNQDLGKSPRNVSLTVNPTFFNFDSDGLLTTDYTNLVLTATAFGYKNPVFKFTGGGFNNPEISQTADTVFSAGTNFVGIKTLDKVDEYSTTDLVFTVTVADELDENNLDKQSTATITIPFVKDGAGGAAGKLVRLTSDDYSVVYDSSGANPSPTGTLTFTATASNFTDPYFKFTGDGISDETSYTDGTGNTDTFSFTIPSETSSWASNPLNIRVGVSEAAAPANEVAFDTISIFYVASGADGDDGIDGYTVITTNSAHTFTADNTGTVSTYSGSGTSIEVYKGGLQLNSVTGTPTEGQFSVSVSATNITEGSSNVSGLAYLIGDHSNMIADTAIVTYTLNIENLVSGAQKQTFSKSKQGADGIDGADGADGSAGTDARAVNLTCGDQVFTYNTEGTTPSPSNTEVIATALNTSGTVYYEFFKNDVSVQNTTSNTYNYIPQTIFSDMPDKIEVQIREGSSSGTIFARDQLTISGIKPGEDGTNGTDGTDGLDGITVVLSNEAHTLPTTNIGIVTYTGSGTTIRVYEGATELSYDGSGTSNGTWAVSKSGSSITPGSTTDSGLYATINNHSNMTANIASVTYTLSGKRLDGTSFSITKIQSLSKSLDGADGADGIDGADGADGAAGTNARAVNLTCVDQVFTYNTEGTTPAPSSTTVTATALNTIGTVYYQFFKNDVSVQNTTSSTYNYTPQSSFANMPDKIEVQIREGSSSNPILARDQLTMSGVKPGTDGTDGTDGLDGITVVLSNEAHTLPTTNTGTITYTGSGTTIRVYEGATELSYNGLGTTASTWAVSKSGSSITPGSTTDSGIYATINQHSNMTATTASITYTITGRRSDNTSFSFIKLQTFSKSIEGADGIDGEDGINGTDGADGADGLRTAEGYVYYNTATTSAPAGPDDGSVYYYWSNGSILGMRSGWQQSPPEMGAGANGQYYYSRYRVVQSSPTSTIEVGSVGQSGTLVFDSPQLGHNFEGLVTFSSGDFQLDGSTITTIDGGNIDTGTITLSKLSSSTFSDGSHTFSLDEQGITLNGAGWDTTALFGSAETTTCIALTTIATGNGTTTRGLFAAARAGVAASFIQDSTQAWGGTSSKYIDLCSYNGDLIAGGLNGEKFSIDTNGRIESVGELATKGIQSKAGTSATSSGSIFNFRWTSPNAECWVDTTNIGTFIQASDYRIKQDVETQTEPAIERVKQIRPVTYTYTNNETLMSVADGVAREGFIAHELAAVIPSAVQGEKDAENQIQSLKLDALCSVLVKALQEQQVIIESLEARITQLETS